jgi:NADPH2:quinone reductase
VVALGPGTDPALLGRRVIVYLRRGGAFADLVAAPQDAVFPVPDSLDDVHAAALHVTYQTGYVALHRRAGLREGETLLVHAGAGGVGSAAIELGRAAGAHVIATAGGSEKVALCRELGATLALDYRATDFVAAVNDATEGRGADVIYDPVGGDTFDRSRRCIAFEGRILVIGFAGGRIAEAPTNHALVKNYSVVGVHWALYEDRCPEVIRDAHLRLVALHESGAISPRVSRVIPFGDVPAGLADLAARGTTGKIVARTG